MNSARKVRTDTQEKIDKAVSFGKEGLTTSQIAKKMNTSPQSISYYLKVAAAQKGVEKDQLFLIEVDKQNNEPVDFEKFWMFYKSTLESVKGAIIALESQIALM